MHPPPNHSPGRKKKSKIKEKGHYSREKRLLPFLDKKTSFPKTQHSADDKLQNKRKEYEVPKLLPTGSTGKGCVFFKRLEEVVHGLFLNFIWLLARQTISPPCLRNGITPSADWLGIKRLRPTTPKNRQSAHNNCDNRKVIFDGNLP
jgi:hypothetical protein